HIAYRRSLELVIAPEPRQLVQRGLDRITRGRPVLGPPCIAAERLVLLRRAFRLAVEDPELKADAEKQRLALDPTPGDDAERVIKALYATPASVVERTRRIVAVASGYDQLLIDILFLPILGNGTS